jgi:pimeloyl-ACP methyl ester carboxylesterase
LAYRRTGQRGACPVVAIHGVTGSSISFSQVNARLAELGSYDLIAVDLRGHGQSDAPAGAPYTPSDHVADVAGLLEQLGLRQVHLTGHSLGSFVALELAATRPGLVSSLSLIGTGGRVEGNPQLRQLLADASLFDQFSEAHPIDEAFMKQWFPSVELNYDPAFATALRLNALNAPPHGFQLAIAGIGNDPQAPAQVVVPVQIIWGTEDAFFCKQDQMSLIGSLGSDMILFEAKRGYGHDTHWEGHMGEQIADDIWGFLGLIS